ncbi:hypothetical protein Z517_10070 [Fonsecaea pedrosoi CBS 271.37]|uniref:SNF2 N-terminal domain-containing protein n=1 Tax=Fonsecaea pedrosoi CBS 271.37 TaxID=1442368 RepID=A0A0D2GYY7_9EURO|nr:uncharacterized protein Z517_10070 [Fonsecaea pedrosoi CBS 271.37]KIW77624.1 hypothetical protein Z517_10070 [Fonsecaea pedrosoi CBS 271.37]
MRNSPGDKEYPEYDKVERINIATLILKDETLDQLADDNDCIARNIERLSKSSKKKVLGIDPDYRKLDKGIYTPPTDKTDPTPFYPKYYQVIGTVWQMDMEECPCGGGLVAKDCGLGKTSQCYAYIYHAAMKKLGIWQEYLERRDDAITHGRPLPKPPKVDFRPTLVVAPPTTRPVLDLRIFYGTDRTLSTDVEEDLRAIMLPSNPLAARDAIEQAFPADDPMSAFGIKSIEDKFRTTTGQPERDDDSINTLPGDVNATASTATADLPPEEDDAGLREESDDCTVYTSLFAGLFYRVVYDEAHKVKNPKTMNAIAIEKLYAPKKWFITATPIVNRVSDLLGYLYLL